MAKANVAKIIHESLQNGIIGVWISAYDLDVTMGQPYVQADERELVKKTLEEYDLEITDFGNDELFECDRQTAQILLGQVLPIVDNREIIGEISLERFVKNIDLLDTYEPAIRHYADFIVEGGADLDTYDALMQTLAFGEIVYG